jgi:hypothetical protein
MSRSKKKAQHLPRRTRSGARTRYRRSRPLAGRSAQGCVARCCRGVMRLIPRERDSLAVRPFAGTRSRLGTWQPPRSPMTRLRPKLRPPESRVGPAANVSQPPRKRPTTSVTCPCAAPCPPQ